MCSFLGHLGESEEVVHGQQSEPVVGRERASCENLPRHGRSKIVGNLHLLLLWTKLGWKMHLWGGLLQHGSCPTYTIPVFSSDKFQEHLAIHRPGKYCLPFEVRLEGVSDGLFEQF